MCKKNCLRLFATGLLISPSVWSQSSNMDAHVHGEAELTIATEGAHIEMQLRSPAANVVGFEHAPVNAEQTEQIHRAENILENANILFGFSGADCSSTSTAVDMPYGSHSEEEHHQDQHSEDHQEYGADEHESGSHEGHSEVIANYIFECDSDELTQIQIKFLTEFPVIETLDVQWITPTKQGAQELSANKPWVDLR